MKAMIEPGAAQQEPRTELRDIYVAKLEYDKWGRSVLNDSKAYTEESRLKHQMEQARNKALQEELRKQMDSKSSLKKQEMERQKEEYKTAAALAEAYRADKEQHKAAQRARNAKIKAERDAQLDEMQSRKQRENMESVKQTQEIVDKALREQREERRLKAEQKDQEMQKARSLLAENNQLRTQKQLAKQAEVGSDNALTKQYFDQLTLENRRREYDLKLRMQRIDGLADTRVNQGFAPFESTATKKYKDYYGHLEEVPFMSPRYQPTVDPSTPRRRLGGNYQPRCATEQASSGSGAVVPRPPSTVAVGRRGRAQDLQKEREAIDQDTKAYFEKESIVKQLKRDQAQQHRQDLVNQMKDRQKHEIIAALESPRGIGQHAAHKRR